MFKHEYNPSVVTFQGYGTNFCTSYLNFRYGNNCCLYCSGLLQQINVPLAENNWEEWCLKGMLNMFLIVV